MGLRGNFGSYEDRISASMPFWKGLCGFKITALVAKFLQGPEPSRGRTREESDPQDIQIPSLDLVPWNSIHDWGRSNRGVERGWR